MIRRLQGLALGACLLVLNVERADRACARHAASAPPAGHAVHGASHDHGVVHGDASATEDASCRTPVQPDCCQALASCSLAFSPSAAVLSTFIPAPEGAFAALTEIPLSRVTTPDPPPPKA